MLAIATTILVLWLLTLLHGGARWLAARAVGMRVGPVSLRLGLRVTGLGPARDAEAAADPRAYPNRPGWQRALVLVAPPLAYWLLATLLTMVVFLVWGVPGPGSRPVIGAVTPGAPAAQAGVMPGDRIVAIDGEAIHGLEQVAPRIAVAAGRLVRIEVERHGQTLTLSVTPVEVEGGGRIGVELFAEEVWVRGAASAALAEGLRFPFAYAKFAAINLAHEIAAPRTHSFAGPVGIVKTMRRTVDRGSREAVMIVAILSILFCFYALARMSVTVVRWEFLRRGRPVAGPGIGVLP